MKNTLNLRVKGMCGGVCQGAYVCMKHREGERERELEGERDPEH